MTDRAQPEPGCGVGEHGPRVTDRAQPEPGCGVGEHGLRATPPIAAAARTLGDAGVASARADAELLASFVLGVPRGRLLLAEFPAPELARYRELVRRRAERVPLQHLTGCAPFRYLELAVGPGVFIPRPETELLVAFGLSTVDVPEPVVVDLCAGTGAIALSVATEWPGARVYAVERDPEALKWLRRNVAALVTVLEGDVTEPATTSTLDGRVDLVLCNPPYVPDGTPVPPEVFDHDPGAAVFGGPDGLAVIRPVVARAAALLRPGGWVGIEHDESQGESVPALFRAAGGFTDVVDHPDLAGRPRFTIARREPGNAQRRPGGLDSRQAGRSKEGGNHT